MSNPEASGRTADQPQHSSALAGNGQPPPPSQVASSTPVSVPAVTSAVHAAPFANIASPANGVSSHQSADSSAPANSANSTPAEPFAALDAAPTAPSTTWNHAGPTRAEAGYLDPSLGWIAVRADSAGNMLHASIVPSTPEAAQVLGSHLAGLNSYLADHHGTVAELTLAAPGSGQSSTGHSGLDSSGQPSGQQQPPSDGQPSDVPLTEPAAHARGASAAAFVAGSETYAAPVASDGHISVIA